MIRYRRDRLIMYPQPYFSRSSSSKIYFSSSSKIYFSPKVLSLLFVTCFIKILIVVRSPGSNSPFRQTSRTHVQILDPSTGTRFRVYH